MSTLWHYTSQEAAYQIVTTKTLHLSNIFFMNDGNEFLWLFQRVIRSLEEQGGKHETVEAVKAHAETILAESSLSKSDNAALRYQIFMMCFSDDGDDISQWERYADGARGVSIRFDPERLQAACDGECLDKVEYLGKDEVLDIDIQGTVSFFTLEWMNLEGQRIKDSRFESEKETRLVAHIYDMNDVKFNRSADRLTPYVERTISDDVISEVRLGPKSLPQAFGAWQQLIEQHYRRAKPTVSRSDLILR